MPVMSHPALPSEQTITVPDEVAFHMERAGWVTNTSVDKAANPRQSRSTPDQADVSDTPKEN